MGAPSKPRPACTEGDGVLDREEGGRGWVLDNGEEGGGWVVDRRPEVEKKVVVPSRKTHGSGRHWSLDNAVHMINNHHDGVW
jgi:hypothetical protein